MKEITFEQKSFIKKEYLLLSGECQKHYHSKDLEQLQLARIKIAVFITTIESLFCLDFYRELQPSLL